MDFIWNFKTTFFPESCGCGAVYWSEFSPSTPTIRVLILVNIPNGYGWLLGWSCCSFPSSKEYLHKIIFWKSQQLIATPTTTLKFVEALLMELDTFCLVLIEWKFASGQSVPWVGVACASLFQQSVDEPKPQIPKFQKQASIGLTIPRTPKGSFSRSLALQKPAKIKI